MGNCLLSTNCNSKWLWYIALVNYIGNCLLRTEAINYGETVYFALVVIRSGLHLFRGESVSVVIFSYYAVIATMGKVHNRCSNNFEIDNDNHPGRDKQIYRKRGSNVLAQFSHWLFPDAASFGGNIWEMSEYPVNSSVERMCRAILVLYHPFQTLEDLTIDGSFHKKFKRLYNNAVPHHIKEVLSNVQMFYNNSM